MVVQYWWSRYGNYRAGKANLPHTGDVIVDYRSRRYPSQSALATACGVDKQTVAHWEAYMYLNSPERRVLLARLLKIPPALLGLTWQQVFYQDNTGTHTDPFSHLAELVEEDSYYHYEDSLTMAWGWFYSGKLLEIVGRFERRLHKLEATLRLVPEHDKDAWKWLLAQYLNLFTQVIQYRGVNNREQKRNALSANAQALKLAKEIEDAELTALLLHGRASIHDEQQHSTQARVAAQAAIDYISKLRVPLSGNIHLLAANILAPHVGNNETQEKEIRGWHDKALNMVWKGNIEPDNSFLKLNLAGVHHERARLFLQLHQLHPHRGLLADAQNEMKLAWDAFSPDINEWAVYFHLAEVQIAKAENDLERCAREGIAALNATKAMQSKKREPQIQALYYDMLKIDAGNPYVHNLGMELGIY